MDFAQAKLDDAVQFTDQWKNTRLLFIILHCKTQATEWVTADFVLDNKNRLNFLRTAAQVHQLAGEVHTLLNERQVLCLSRQYQHTARNIALVFFL